MVNSQFSIRHLVLIRPYSILRFLTIRRMYATIPHIEMNDECMSRHSKFSRGVRKHLRQEKARIRRAFANDPKQAGQEIVLLLNNFTSRVSTRKE